MTRAHPTHPKTWLWTAAMTAVAIATAALSGACGSSTAPAITAPVTSPTSKPSPTIGTDVLAEPVLRRIAGQLVEAPADQSSGEYLHTTQINVYRDTQYPHPVNGGEGPLVVTLLELWRSPDGSRGRQLSTQFDGKTCTLGDDSTWSDKRYQESFRPRATADVKQLRSLLVSGAGRTPAQPVDVLAGIAGVYEDDVVEKPVRAAMLRILAEQPGIVAREGATDQLGRTGILVSLPYVDSEGVKAQYHLLFQQSTGELLSAFETITGPVPATFDPRLGPDAAASIIASHDGTRLFLESRYTEDTAGTAVGCESPFAGVATDLSTSLTASPTPVAPVPAGSDDAAADETPAPASPTTRTDTPGGVR